MELTIEQLKDQIANMDADVYVARQDYAEIIEWLESDGYEVTDMDVRQVVDELASETFFKRIAANLAK